MKFRTVTARLSLSIFASFLAIGSVFAQSPRSADKISGAILAHEKVKLEARDLAPRRREARLRAWGLNAQDLEAEACALYVRRRLSAAEIDALATRGIRISPGAWVPPVPGRHPSGFYLAHVRYESLDSVRRDARIVRLASTEFALKTMNDVSRTVVNVDRVHNGVAGSPFTGAGVKIAIADTGVDLSHPDFPAPVETFDMTDGVGPATWDLDVSNTVIDHGTHVSGIVLGRGLLSDGKFRGSAPDADFYFYKISDDVTMIASEEDMIEAIIRAHGVGCHVFSLSFGGFSEYMDGSGPAAQAMDAAAEGGMISFVSAGNEAMTRTHVSAVLEPGAASAPIEYRLSATSSGEPFTDEVSIRVIWIDDDPSDLNIVMTGTNLGEGESLTAISGGVSPRGTEARCYVLTPQLAPATNKTYQFVLENQATGGSAPLVHCYRDMGNGTFVNADPDFTVTYPSIADSAVSVAAWVHRRSWTDFRGKLFVGLFSEDLNTRASFSSLGPRIDGALKPDVAAPGSGTISTRDSVFSNNSPLIIDNDGLNLDGSGPADYYIKQGTSMAAPMAAAVGALIRQAAPNLTPFEVKQTLLSTASKAAAPDVALGHGLIEALAAVRLAIAGGPTPTPTPLPSAARHWPTYE